MPQLGEPRLLLDEPSLRGRFNTEPLQHFRGRDYGANARGVALADFRVPHGLQGRCGPVPGPHSLLLLSRGNRGHERNLPRIFEMPSVVSGIDQCPAPYFNAAAIRARAISTFSRELKALIRTWPSPHLPNPAPGVQTTWAWFSSRSKNSHESRPVLIQM